MVLTIFSIIVYVFFIYGVIEFLGKIYLDATKNKKSSQCSTIKVLIEDYEDLEYTIKILKKYFNHIVILLDKDSEEIPKTLIRLSEDLNIEYRYLGQKYEAGGL